MSEIATAKHCMKDKITVTVGIDAAETPIEWLQAIEQSIDNSMLSLGYYRVASKKCGEVVLHYKIFAVCNYGS